jgi:exonuclease SbcC
MSRAFTGRRSKGSGRSLSKSGLVVNVRKKVVIAIALLGAALMGAMVLRRNLAGITSQVAGAGLSHALGVSDIHVGRVAARGIRSITLADVRLAEALDKVAEAATRRLQVMSKGRYSLRRTLDRRTARSAGGLGLEVFDMYTGRERSVTTLSGGEGFMASLSLALGLADVVQSYAGGIHLDTMFIDEGFGALDPESLDLALDTLINLQRDSGRLVGVISHVPELEERIDARLEVEMTETGSTTRFVVG